MRKDELVQPTAVEPRAGSRIWISYVDGPAGEVDLSPLAGRGIYAAWNDRAHCQIHITEHRSIAWDDEIELCVDALYLQLTGLSLE